MGRTSNARELLIESAGALWHARSYGDVGVNEICECAGVRKGSFYHFFPSKQDLALAMIDEYRRRFRRRFVRPALADGLAPLDRITRLVELQIEFLAGEGSGECIRGCPFGNLVMELSTQDPVLRERLEQVFDESLEFFEDALGEAVAAGDLTSIDVHQTARAMQAYMQGVFLLAKAKNDIEIVRELGPGILRLAGVEPPKRNRGRKAA